MFRWTIAGFSVIAAAVSTVAVDWDSFDFSATYDEPPIAVITVQPDLPEDAEIGEGGELLTAVLVDVEGKVSDAVLLEDDVPSNVEAAVIEAVLQNRYEPAKYQGQPVEVWYMISVSVSPPAEHIKESRGPASLTPRGLEKKLP
ncbi:MAG: hypothetical protein GY771_15720 [bacterium]|nr:hypothetical protein [bacterium]